MSLLSDRRRYDVACPIACALDTVGERWTLLILRELLPGPMRFSELKVAVPGINATILSRRLDQMRDEGLLAYVDLPNLANGYAATPRAATLWPLLLALAAWGAGLAPQGAEGLTAAAAVTTFLALRPLSAPRQPMGFTLQAPRIAWAPEGPMPLIRGEGESALEIVTTPQDLLDLATGRLAARAALDAGRLSLAGEAQLFLDHLPA